MPMSAAANNATPTNSLNRRDTVEPFTSSDLHDHRQHERPPAGTLAEEAAQLDPHLLLDQSLVGLFFNARLPDDAGQHRGPIGQQLLAVFHDETAGDDVRR